MTSQAEKVIIGDAELYCGEAEDVLPELSGVDACVVDSPYGLRFMGKRWDYAVPSVELWELVFDALKPGAHLLSFAGTRTQHRMAVNIEDAGFEIRDMIAWVYGSGFPKSLDVSKAIDKAARAERDVTGLARGHVDTGGVHDDYNYVWEPLYERRDIPATDAAKQWQGWGTGLKPALETVTFASKPYTQEQERDIILSNLIRLEARLWLLSSASAAEKSSTLSQSEYGEACAIAQWSADEITSTQAALCGQMGTSPFELATTTSLSIVSSWRRTLEESSNDGSMSTIETESSTIIDWRTLKFSLSQITPENIIKVCSLPGGFNANASIAGAHLNASLSLLQSIHTLSATEHAISLEQQRRQAEAVKPALEPITVARKPLSGTVAANVLEHGTGGVNVDGCRVMADDGQNRTRPPRTPNQILGGGKGTNLTASEHNMLGRFPANLIHDGSDEVLALFPATASGKQANGGHVRNTDKHRGVYQPFAGQRCEGDVLYGDAGSAARFFYCAKASRAERGDGNNHPTVKPIDLMRYLCRLVTPPGGIVLDHMMGSGSTIVAAMLEGFRAIGIERDREHFDIACQRIENAQRQGALFAPDSPADAYDQTSLDYER